MTDTLTAALKFAAAGWPVFPCRPGRKEPLTSHGLLDASTNADTIRAWWLAWPQANVAIATGSPGPDVVDIDVKDGAPGIETRARLARAGLLRGAFAEVHTWSGGAHLYYPGTQQGNGSKKKHGVDFRSKGGYVIAPPSIVEGKPYAAGDQIPMDEGRAVSWDRIVAFLDPPRPVANRSHGNDFGDPASPLARWAAGEVDRILAGGIPTCRDTSRSGTFHELVGLCRKAGMTEAQTVATIEPWCDATGKYRGRVDREVARSWTRKVGAAA